METIEVTAVLPVSPDRLYRAWIDPDDHAAITGAGATGEPCVGGRFTAFDGYISGTHNVLEPGRRIVQTWRATDFPAIADDSRLEVRFEAVDGGTRLVLLHEALPPGTASTYEQGWVDFYVAPLRAWAEAS